MSIETPYYVFPSAFTQEECKKIISLGLDKEPEEAETMDLNHKKANRNIKQADKTSQELQKEFGTDVTNINPLVRDSAISWLNDSWIYDKIYPFVIEANTKAGWNYDFDSAEELQFTTYQNGGFYGWHRDGGSCHKSAYLKNVPDEEKIKGKEKYYTTNDDLVGKIRKLSLTINLSKPEDYEGGNLKFDWGDHQKNNRLYECKEIRPQGSLVVFPSFWYHQVTPVTKGKRHSLVCWVLGAPFR